MRLIQTATAALVLLAACKPEGASPKAVGPAATAAAAPASSTSTSAASGALAERTVEITADDKGFTPSRIEAKAHEPLVLRFTRTVENTCADQVMFKGDPVKHNLPLGKTIEVRVTAPESGALAFACGMNMYRGSVVVQ